MPDAGKPAVQQRASIDAAVVELAVHQPSPPPSPGDTVNTESLLEQRLPGSVQRARTAPLP